MGTAIKLELEGLTLTYSKNFRGTDHGMLFQQADRMPVRSDQVDYNYYAEHNEDPSSMEMSFVKPLKGVLPRLELLWRPSWTNTLKPDNAARGTKVS